MGISYHDDDQDYFCVGGNFAYNMHANINEFVLRGDNKYCQHTTK